MKLTLNPEQKLRKLGSHFMIVDSCSGVANIANVYVLNDTAAWLWEKLEGRDFDENDMAALLCASYDVDPIQALNDARRLIDIWRKFNLIL